MNRFILAAVSSTTLFGSLAPLSFAGTPPPLTSAPPAPSTCFKSEELQLDLFGVAGFGHPPDHAGPFRKHVGGGGVGLNYFWTENLGIGADADALQGWKNKAVGNDHKVFGQYTASLIFRLPMEEYALAPYAYAGGGLTTGIGQLGSAHAGIGLEYRICPSQVGLFADTRWTYYGDRLGRGDQNNVQIRAGLRLLF